MEDINFNMPPPKKLFEIISPNESKINNNINNNVNNNIKNDVNNNVNNNKNKDTSKYKKVDKIKKNVDNTMTRVKSPPHYVVDL